MPFFVSLGFEKGQSRMPMIRTQCALYTQCPILLVADSQFTSDCYST